MFKDQHKWKTPRNPTTNLGSRSSKRFNFEAGEGDNETMDTGETPEEGVKDLRGGKLQRKGSKRRQTTPSLI